jgi:acyl carrier protein
MTGPELDSEIRTILREHVRLTADVATLDADSDLYRAGMTSHASVNLMLALEDKFGVEFPERMLRRKTFETIAAIQGAIAELVAEKA